MKEKLIFALFLLSFSTLYTFAQTKTVDNFDLEKYRQSRLQAEKDLRENYEKLGFASPEELAKQNEKDAAEREELSNRLRNERLERERIENERRQIAAEAERYTAESQFNQPDAVYSSGYYSGYGVYGYPSFYRPGYSQKHRYRVPGYRATPVGIYPVPASPGPSRVLFIPRARRH